jgi:PAS domain-containing protein
MIPPRDAYRDVFDAAGDGLIISDVETGRVVDANPAAIAMHGYSREEFIGLGPERYLVPKGERAFLADPRPFGRATPMRCCPSICAGTVRSSMSRSAARR